MDYRQEGRRLQQQLSSFLDIPHDIVLDLPKITLIGNIQLYIENHRGIIEYSPETVRISVSIGEIEIKGKDLRILTISRDELSLDGTIHSITCNR